jgi:hypothetical protein
MRVKLTAPEIVKMPAALIVSAVAGSIWPSSLKPAENSSSLAAVLNLTDRACSPGSSTRPSASSSQG